MPSTRYSYAALILLCGIGTANAADPNLLAQTGGFLLGNAYRCGVSVERISRAGTIIRDIISAASADLKEAEAADMRFRDRFMSSARSESNLAVSTPPCGAVLVNFERLERHHQEAGYSD
jgi:hypothetical protein